MNGKAARHVTPPDIMTPLRWAAWLTIVVTSAVLLTALAYILILMAFYGPGSTQDSRLHLTLKNNARIAAETPQAVAAYIQSEMVFGDAYPVPADPLAAAMLAPVASASNRTIVYGAAGSDAVSVDALLPFVNRPVVILASSEEPAYALPAAYAAAHFRVPLILTNANGIDEAALAAIGGVDDKLLLVAAPERLIPDELVDGLRGATRVERVASDDIYQHAIEWSRYRAGDFGWGIERGQKDGYFNFVLANPADPEFAAAALALSYKGNYGPLLYTDADALPAKVEAYLWYFSPDFFGAPSDGPFAQVWTVGPTESVSYAAQARADFALETHAYRNQVIGWSGMAVLGWCWVLVGLTGGIWALFALPARVPMAGFYPRLYWPLAIFVLGPIGLIAFIVSYQGRLIDRSGPMPRFVRPAWARAVSATIMGMSVGMALMIAIMWLAMLNGMPMFTAFAYTPWFWLASPMAALMWFLMVGGAILISTLLFMGPMMAEMNGKPYGQGVRMAFPVVAISMIAASVGMFTLAWWWQNWALPMAGEEVPLWPTVFWWAALMGFLTALIPNYWLVRRGVKSGVM